MAVATLSAALLAPATAVHAAPSVGELTQRINKSSAELEKVVESYNKLNEEIKATRAAAAEISAKLGPLESQVEQRRSEVTLLAGRAYKAAGLETANALLGIGPDQFGQLGTLDHFARQRQRQIDALGAAQRELRSQREKLDTTLARQTAQAKALAASKKKIEADLDKLYELRRKAYGSATSRGSKYTGSIPAVSGSAGKAVNYAYGAIGKPYVWAADGPNGYDCSGLTLAAWRAAGKSLPHNAAMQWDRVAHISRGSLRPGDLVFYNSLGHVALYVGSGKVIHAPTFGDHVKLSGVDMMPPYGYGRVR